MPLKPYEDVSQEPLAFPVGGKTYVVPPLGYRAGLRLQRLIAGSDDELANLPAEEGWRLVLGVTFDAMVEDDVPAEAIARAGLAAMADFQQGREFAEAIWESGIDPELLAAAATAATKQQGSTASRSTAGASKTRSRASSSGTTSRRATKRAAGKGSSSRS